MKIKKKIRIFALYNQYNMWSNWQTMAKSDAKIPEYLLWDMDIKQFDTGKGRRLIAERVAERGNLQDFYTMFSLYGGVENVRNIYKNEVNNLNPRAMAFICAAFDLKQEEMKCYTRRRSQTVPWNY
ncbi:hypothetical protein FACS1894182_11390 [Bacteroidia bacterium]|nr:hypothetical protein FACS1894182_11390 [Bacteroidia bacterium]